MAKQKKQILVSDVVDECNRMLRDSYGDSDYRHGVILVLETVLNKTNNYRGFQYLGVGEVPGSQLPGIRWEYVDGESRPDFKNTDDTRRRYS